MDAEALKDAERRVKRNPTVPTLNPRQRLPCDSGGGGYVLLGESLRLPSGFDEASKVSWLLDPHGASSIKVSQKHNIKSMSDKYNMDKMASMINIDAVCE
nr:hypothetical protein [Leucobacter sp. 7(1)]